MRTLFVFIALLVGWSAQAQYRFSTATLLSSSTNYNILANTNITVNSSFAVGAGNKALIVLSFQGADTNAAGTNPIVANFQKSIDGSHWTNSFALLVTAVTNVNVWGYTNVDVSDAAWLRLYTFVSSNSVTMSNAVVFIGQKVGL